jgi:hypothetical protein
MDTAAKQCGSRVNALLSPHRETERDLPVRLDRSTHLALFEGKRRLLKRLLHLASGKKSEVSTFGM